MNRPPQAHTLQLLHKLRERIPGLALRTTFISGFPGEGGARPAWAAWRSTQGGPPGMPCAVGAPTQHRPSRVMLGMPASMLVHAPTW